MSSKCTPAPGRLSRDQAGPIGSQGPLARRRCGSAVGPWSSSAYQSASQPTALRGAEGGAVTTRRPRALGKVYARHPWPCMGAVLPVLVTPPVGSPTETSTFSVAEVAGRSEALAERRAWEAANQPPQGTLGKRRPRAARAALPLPAGALPGLWARLATVLVAGASARSGPFRRCPGRSVPFLTKSDVSPPAAIGLGSCP